MDDEMMKDDTASFGYRDVPRGEKSGLVRGVFDSVAGRYDLMNDLMSAGVHRAWKGAMIDWLAPRPGQRLLDVAGGTGDIAFRFLDKAARRAPPEGPQARAVLCDINHEMLKEGAKRAGQRADRDRISIVCGDAERLPLPSAHFDVYTIAFGIRNVTDMDAALAEARRVLKPGGRFMCLEFSHMATEGQQAAYDAYSFNVIPRLGELVAGDREAYQYLVESIRKFPAQKEFASRIEAAGFSKATWRNFTGGVAACHSAWRI
ncbi:MAG: class I SAM-dependent methyltransferase [Pseudomonadota bacterium]